MGGGLWRPTDGLLASILVAGKMRAAESPSDPVTGRPRADYEESYNRKPPPSPGQPPPAGLSNGCVELRSDGATTTPIPTTAATANPFSGPGWHPIDIPV